MKLLTLLISAILLGAACSQASASDIQKRSIRYIERIRNYASSFNNQGIPLKAERLSNNGGNIVLTYDESLPDSIQTSFLVAKGLWESKLPMTQPIFISVSFEPLGDDISMICDVIYSATPDLMGCPCALASQISNSPWGSIDSPDGYVILNSDIDWNCRFSNDATSDYNLPTMVLRGIARCLGFGSGIVERSKDEFSYFLGSPTYFDKLLYCDGNALSNLPEKSSAMADFVKSNKVYAHTESRDYKIYAPDEFV